MLVLFILTLVVNTAHGMECGTTNFYDNSGHIEVGKYEHGAQCTYDIELNDKSRWIRLEWRRFDVDGDMPDCKDHVKIYTGCSYSKKLVATFCSNNMVSSVPHDIYSPTGCMEIVFSAVGSTVKSRLGFEAKFNSGKGGIASGECSRFKTLKASTGVITSPNWPQMYDWIDFSNDYQCDWTIKRSTQETVQLNFMDFDMINTASPFCVSPPYVSVQDTEGTPRQAEKYCAAKNPFTTTINSKTVSVKMTVVDRYIKTNGRGFAVGYVAYRVNTDNTSSSSGNSTSTLIIVLLGVVAVVFIIAVIICACRKVSKWRQRQPAVAVNRRIETVPIISNPYGSEQQPAHPSYTQPSHHPSYPPSYPPQQYYPQKQQPYSPLPSYDNQLGAPPPYSALMNDQHQHPPPSAPLA